MFRKRPPPLLPRQAIIDAINSQPASRDATRTWPKEVFDSHVHLWASERILSKLYWAAADPEGTAVVWNDHDAKRYARSAALLEASGDPAARPKLSGAAHIQIEVAHREGEWENAYDEVDWLVQEEISQLSYMKTLIPWAPLDEGADAMQTYYNTLLKNLAGSSHVKVRGFRYLLQDFAPGQSNPMLSERFIEGLEWMGGQGLHFEMTIDSKRFGPQALTDVVECISRVRQGQDPDNLTIFVLDHLGKADLAILLTEHGQSYLDEFGKHLSELAFIPKVYVKFSGYLSLLPPALVQEALRDYIEARPKKGKLQSKAYKECLKALSTLALPLLEAFGEHRIMWGGDWPICKLGVVGPGTLSADQASGTTPEEVQELVLAFNYQMALDVFRDIGLTGESLDRIFYLNAKELYTPE